ncbi:ribosome maturation factor RimM [Pseudomonas oryzihabitans]|uniref:Ribosome maturation factor RimM n=1 Tax=Pseudomonas oryzihabitans TaxID=47885 RepID=A0A0U4PAZ0_9PSED|nr:ribosome maturation factor RimM [Pseudomonas oryzihabitans]ALZ85935.1 ribosome maturation factor RimM [Pseudomonas oryzihabitans]HAC67004.1 ribosome maturation factor RimM [Pseudomonas sp.]
MSTPTPAPDLVVLGKIVSVFGVRGELKIYSFTDPLDNLLDYRTWTLRREGEIRQVKVLGGRLHGKVLTVRLQGLDDREEARLMAGFEICVPRSELPQLGAGDYYWHQLEGLKVINREGQWLGVVDHLLETGANDVMVVKPSAGSLDDRERLLPYLPDQYVLAVDLAKGEMQVDWDADF